MEIMQAQYKQLADCLPKQRSDVQFGNIDLFTFYAGKYRATELTPRDA
jgi:hypothetical protein